MKRIRLNEEKMSTSHKISALSFLSAICFLSLIGVSTPRPTGEPPPSQLQWIPQPRQLQGLWTPHSYGRETQAPPLRVGASMSEKRTMPNHNHRLVKMKIIGFQSMGVIYPIAGAAKFLEDFYSNIAIKASTVWKTETRRDYLTIDQGPFRLTINSIGDTISWEWVQAVADSLWESAALGMAEFFQAYYATDSGMVGTAISLKFVDGAESSSGYSVGSSDWREGSVPSVGSR